MDSSVYDDVVDQASVSQLRRLLSLADPEARQADVVDRGLADVVEWAGMLDEIAAPEADHEAMLRATFDPATPLALLSAIRDTARELGRQAGENRGAHRAAAHLLYNATLAAAEIHHGVNLARRDPALRRDLYRKLAEVLNGSAAGNLFAIAANRQ